MQIFAVFHPTLFAPVLHFIPSPFVSVLFLHHAHHASPFSFARTLSIVLPLSYPNSSYRISPSPPRRNSVPTLSSKPVAFRPSTYLSVLSFVVCLFLFSLPLSFSSFSSRISSIRLRPPIFSFIFISLSSTSSYYKQTTVAVTRCAVLSSPTIYSRFIEFQRTSWPFSSLIYALSPSSTFLPSPSSLHPRRRKDGLFIYDGDDRGREKYGRPRKGFNR